MRQPVKHGRLEPTLEKTYARYAFEPIEAVGGFAYDSISEWASTCQNLINAGEEAILTIEDPELRESERDHLRKMVVCWRDKGYGSLVTEEGVKVRNREQAEFLRAALTRRGKAVAAALRAMTNEEITSLWGSAPVPIASGKGAPYWFSSQHKEAAVWLAKIAEGSGSYKECVDRVWSVGSARIRPVITCYLRVQGAAKPQPAYYFNGTYLEPAPRRFGPKIRKVQALPFVFNWFFVRVAWVMKAAMMTSFPGNTGRIADALALATKYKYAYAYDLANYDDTVAWETDRLYAEVVLTPALAVLRERGLLNAKTIRLILEIDEAESRMPILTPPHSRHDAAEIVETLGGIRSGQRLTSDKGTHINAARAEALCAMIGWDAVVINWGDDTVILTNDPSKAAAYAELAGGPGFNETKADRASFLMRDIRGGYGYLGRMLASSINKEARFEPRSLEVAALGLRARADLLKTHPLGESTFWSCIQAAGSKRLTAAAMLAQHAPIQTLMDIVSNTQLTGLERLRLAGLLTRTIDDFETEGNYSPETMARLKALADPLTERVYMSANQFQAHMDAIPVTEAARQIRRGAYTARSFR